MRAFCVVTTRCSLATVSPSGGEGGEGTNSRRLTRIRFHLKKQLFLRGYGFCPHASDENDHWNGTFQKALKSGTFWQRCIRAYVWTDETGTLLECDVTLLVPIDSAQYYKLIQDDGQVLHFLVFTTLAYFTPNCLLSSKLSFAVCSSLR